MVFHALPPEYALCRVHIPDNFLRDDSVYQSGLLVFNANLSALFCTLSSALTCPSLCRYKPAAHILILVAQGTYMPGFWCYYSPFLVYSLQHAVLSTLLLLCNFPGHPNVGHLVKLFLSNGNCSNAVFPYPSGTSLMCRLR
jgi:hypothetical protein